MKNTWAGFENSGFWQFSRSAFNDEDYEVVSVERCVLTALSLSVTSSSVAQVDNSLGKKVTPQQVCLYPRAASNVGRRVWQLKGRWKIQTLAPENGCIHDLAAKRRPSGTPSPKPRKEVKHVLQKCVKRLRYVWFIFNHPRKQFIYRVRWLQRWYGLHYPATWAKWFCCNSHVGNFPCPQQRLKILQ